MKNGKSKKKTANFHERVEDRSEHGPNHFILVNSFGGVATTALIDFFSKYKKVNDVDNRDGLKHRRTPPNLSFISRAIYIFGNPLDSIVYHFNVRERNKEKSWGGAWVKKHCKNMQGEWYEFSQEWDLDDYVGNGKDLFKMKEHFDNWEQAKVNYPIMFIRYETMWEHLDEIFDFLGISKEKIKNFPQKRKRRGDWRKLPEKTKKKLLEMYGSFAEEIEKFDDIGIKNPSLRLPDKKKFVLITTLYNEEHEERRKEYIECLRRNLNHHRIKRVIVFYDTARDKEGKESALLEQIKKKGSEVVCIKGRPTYEDIFKYANKNFPSSRIIVANGDIYFNWTLRKLDYFNLCNSFLVLTRWNVTADGRLDIFRQGKWSGASQDAWIFKTPLEINFKCDLKMGTFYCDSFLNCQVEKSGLNVSNPCWDIQCCHLHLTEIKSSDDVELRNGQEEYRKEQMEKGNFIVSVKWGHIIFNLKRTMQGI